MRYEYVTWYAALGLATGVRGLVDEEVAQRRLQRKRRVLEVSEFEFTRLSFFRRGPQDFFLISSNVLGTGGRCQLSFNLT